jgi:hypothetical protein
VADWLEKLEPEEREAAHFIAAVNAALELRHSEDQMSDDTAVKELLSLV